jgi:hypothetical protein
MKLTSVFPDHLLCRDLADFRNSYSHGGQDPPWHARRNMAANSGRHATQRR